MSALLALRLDRAIVNIEDHTAWPRSIRRSTTSYFFGILGTPTLRFPYRLDHHLIRSIEGSNDLTLLTTILHRALTVSLELTKPVMIASDAMPKTVSVASTWIAKEVIALVPALPVVKETSTD